MPILLNAKLCMSVTLSHVLDLVAPSLEVVLLAGHTLRLALAHNLLAQPLGREAVLQLVQVHNDVPAALDDRILGCDSAVGGDAELESREERVGDFVRREDDVVVLEEALGEEVAERVIFFVEGEDGGVGDACSLVRSDNWGGGRHGV